MDKLFYNINSKVGVQNNKLLYVQPKILKISAGDHSIVIHNRQIWAWGRNSFGQLGNNLIALEKIPVSIHGDKKINFELSANNLNSSLIDINGQVWTWGYNLSGQLGVGDTISRLTPVSILGAKKTFCKISQGGTHTISIDKGNDIWSWGGNIYGQLGDNSIINRCTPVLLLQFVEAQYNHISAGYNYTTSIDISGIIWSWGYNNYGQLGDNSVINRSMRATLSGALKTFCQISAGGNHVISIDQYGILWAWGYNNLGQLGNNSLTNRCTPVLVKITKTFCKISAGYDHSIAIDKDGQIWAWGNNKYGQLGNSKGDISIDPLETTPVSILGAKKTFCQISTSNYHNLSVDNRGHLWSWGNNSYGQLGDNTLINRVTPVKIYPFPEKIGYDIGDKTSGGTIAYILRDGDPGYESLNQHGIIISDNYANDISYIWGCNGTALGTSNNFGSGPQNTRDMSDNCGNDSIGYIIFNYSDGTYDDWYIPSKNETIRILFNSQVLSLYGLLHNKLYIWTSSESSDYYSYNIDFNYYTINALDKRTYMYTMAVRNF